MPVVRRPDVRRGSEICKYCSVREIPDDRREPDVRTAERDRTSVEYRTSGDKLELVGLSKSFTRSNDPLLIVRDPYTQEQTVNKAKANVLYLQS